MTEGEVVLVSGDHPHLVSQDPLLCEVVTNDVADVPKGSKVTRIDAWNKPHISIEQANRNEKIRFSFPPPPPPRLEIETNSFKQEKKELCVNPHTRVYPKTPPASYKFHSPSTKHEKGDSVVQEEEEDESDGDDGSEEGGGQENNGKNRSEVNTSCLQVVLSTNPRSHSLPMGIKMTIDDLNRISSNSDETVDSEGGSPQEKRKRSHEQLDSAGSDLSQSESSDESSSDGAGDGERIERIIPSPSLETEDDIFIDGELTDMQEEANTKLTNWAYNDFVPACRQLLSQCCEDTKSALVKSANIQAGLRGLSNAITFFCTEQQQRLSQVFQLRPIRGNNQPSASLLTFPRPAKNLVSESSDDRSYAVKVLRSASQSLISPLLVEASQKEGFTPSLHQSIVKALQKIAWKVEACISFSNPSHSVEIHAKIFDDQPIKDVKELMIQVLPPAEPKLQTVPLATKTRKSSEPCFATEFSPPAPMRRGQSVKDSLGSGVQSNTDNNASSELQIISESDKDDDEVWREGSVEAEKEWTLGGAEEERERDRLANAGHDTDHDGEREADEGDVQSPLREDVFHEDTPNLPRRERIATEGEADLMSKVTLTRKKNFGSIPNLEQESSCSDVLTQSGSSSRGEKERYFRPRAFRRTTISLSKREVQKLGLTVAKRVDESILDDIRLQKAKEVEEKKSHDHQRSSKSEEKALPPTAASEGNGSPGQVLQLHPRTRSDHDIENPHDLDRVGDCLHNKLTKEFRHIRSASMSDLLDSDVSTPDPSTSDRESDVFSPQPNQRLELVALKNPLENKRLLHIDTNVRASSPSTPSPNFEKSYIPLNRESQVHPASPTSGDWVIVEAEKTKKQSVKTTVKKRISNPGRFAHSLLKTARSLRTGSKLQQQKLSKSHSAADLLDESSVYSSQQQLRSPGGSNLSRLSFSINPSSSSYDVATLPTRNSRMDTIARIISRRNKSRSRSFGKSDSHISNGLSDLSSNERFNESIETVSRNAIRSMAIESEEQLLISVDVATKLQRKEIRNRKKKESSSDPWFQITVSTNIRQFGRRDYTILRRFKKIKQLIDSLLSSSHGAIDLPRPDKKSGVKKQVKIMEDVLRSIAGNTQLRSSSTFVAFLMPDDEFGSFTENDRSEVSFERLMTFYTPDISSGPPGSFPSVQIVPHEHVPATSSRSPAPPRKSSLTGGHKKGSMHYMKKDGKDDTSTYVIQEEGEDALIVACEDDHYVVVAGTFEKLVEQLACEEKPDARFVTTFLLGYHHFATTLEFLTTLLERFHMTVPPNPTEEEMAYAEKWSYVIQLRVLDILTYWMKKCWPDIYRHPPVLEKVKEFATSLKATDDHNFQYAGNNIEKIITEKMANSVQYSLPPEASSPASLTTSDSPTSTAREHYFSSARGARPPSHAHREQAKRSMAAGTSPRSVSTFPSSPSLRTSSNGSYGMVDICSLPAIRLARQLTLIELEFLRAIDIHELVVYTWDPNTPENKPYRRNLDAFIERFNKVSYWVASEICCVEDVRLRGILLEKFIEVAKYCHELKNYNTTISVLSGLSLAAVRRLKRSWDLVNEKTKKWFNKLQPLTSPATNHSNYRRTLATVHRTDACIPYLGVFMRDLTFFNDGNNKRLKNGLYNFSKLRTMVHKFEELKRYQRSKYTFPTEYKIQECCRNLWCFTDSELYDASLRAEPREETDV